MGWLSTVFLVSLSFVLGVLIEDMWSIRSNGLEYLKESLTRYIYYYFIVLIILIPLSYLSLMTFSKLTILFLSVALMIAGYYLGFRDRDWSLITGTKPYKTTRLFVSILFVGMILFSIYSLSNSYYAQYTIAKNVFEPVKTYNVSNFDAKVKITIIPYETAKRRMSVALSKYGTIYRLVDADYQIINGTIYWVGSVGFDGILRQWKYKDKGIPIAVILNAEKNENAKLVKLKCPMKYSLGNYLGLNIKRYLWKNYPNYYFTEPVLQLHDNEPYYVSMMMKYKGFTIAKEPYKLVVVNACDGSIRLYDLDKVPRWVTFIHQEDEVEDLLYAWGVYKHGLINAIFFHKDIMYPTGNIYVDIENKEVEMSGTDAWIVVINNTPYWFTAFRPPGSKTSMVGIGLVNALTGKMTWVSTPDFYNDYAIMENALQSPEISKTASLKPTQAYPIFYNDSIAWFMSVIGTNNELQLYAVGDSRTGKIFVASNPEDAIRKWISYITGENNVSIQPGEEKNVVFWVIIKRANGTIEKIPVYKGDSVSVEQTEENG